MGDFPKISSLAYGRFPAQIKGKHYTECISWNRYLIPDYASAGVFPIYRTPDGC